MMLVQTFSERENQIIKILGKRTMTLAQIGAELFKDTKVPFECNITVANTVRRIIKKAHYHKLDWTIIKIRENGKFYVKKEKV